jgi:hypothetical protein
MTQDEIIEIARQAGAHDNGHEVRFVEPKYLEAFTKLVSAKVWSDGYQQGVKDERTSEANIGIAGFGMKVEPARENPYVCRARGQQ